MTKREVFSKEQLGIETQHVFYSNEKSSKLALFFPGGSSNTTGPIFYYLRDYLIRNGYDVLYLSYKGLVEQGETYGVQMNKITTAANKVVSYLNGKKDYESTICISRSIGNVISSKTIETYGFSISKFIYISPTEEALSDIKMNPGVLITSGNDEYLSESLINECLSYQNLQVLVFKEGDHSLECDDTLKSMEFCIEAVSIAIEYIKQK